ncbi:NAD-specific glutamate dehydrogenase, putative [Hondaea fermentalgiana]|uniref:NAD-specific glutamate dehydrogenase, putative n=1 Tax=Hondaea fermentalgiana TaxID=2315210 RepID=A0A2R5GKN4_9STRA|nr:NAD-specific glutamate dehydrogenase, putative [Hondaea fermentalgiana]|eukprot:GBG31440.1 NAD-specific glutamate dehydrogenase, putative [Hondaea fermentalgiana]
MVVMEMDDALGQSKERFDELLDMLQREQREAANVKVPWFLQNMPDAYFKQLKPELRHQHLAALVALYDFGAVPDLTLHSDNNNTMTLISGGNNSPQRLVQQIDRMPTNTPLSGMSIFNSNDGEISLNVFRFFDADEDDSSEPAVLSDEIRAYLADLHAGKFEGDPLHADASTFPDEQALERFVRERCRPDYVLRSSPRRFCKQVELYNKIMQDGEDQVGIDIEPNWNGVPHRTMITLAITNVLTMAAMKRISKYFASKNLNNVRTHLDLVRGPATEEERKEGMTTSALCGDAQSLLRSNTVSMIRILVEPHEQDAKDIDMDTLNARLVEDLPTVSKWIDDRALSLLGRYGMSAREADIVLALCDLAHAILAPKDAFEFARSNIENVVMEESRIDFTRAILDLFVRRFDPSPEAANFPEKQNEAFAQRIAEIREMILQSGELETAQRTFSTLLDIVEGTYRTNAFVPGRFGLALRLDPRVCVEHLLNNTNRPEVPHGIFFVHGRRFAGFHVRFRDISRGGLRVVTPRNSEVHGVESARQLKECYDLAFAQQLKNKDIAEGGSKAVCLVDLDGIDKAGKDHVMRKSLKAMVNSVLDLITPDPDDRSCVVDHMGGAEEFIYFGPDEQVTPEHINWIVSRAGQRGYGMPNAFMSSKPDAGINHKVYGVTSEGVSVFLHEALLATGVDVTKPFSVKITGGPDGDVAGNLLKILYREYKDNARIVGLADGTAGLEDPDGINWDELLRMFDEALPLEQFSRDKLGPNSDFYLADTPTNINKRNTMHNRVKADAFVPAGGRPATISDVNWEKYLLPDGTPSSPLIVEGANLFLTPVAREKLGAHGCVIVKDSSANKCGVICSSMEIIASMLLDKAEFLDLKGVFVEDVLDLLRKRAKSEAELMFREYRSNPSLPLPPVSERISRAINRSTDAIAASLEELPEEKFRELLQIVRASLPKSLMDKAWDRFEDRVPEAYTRFQLACILASELVYKEGLPYVESVSDDGLAAMVVDYADRQLQVARLATKVDSGEKLSKDEQDLLSDILRAGGARTMVDHHLRP